jgi:hypothetical protein
VLRLGIAARLRVEQQVRFVVQDCRRSGIHRRFESLRDRRGLVHAAALTALTLVLTALTGSVADASERQGGHRKDGADAKRNGNAHNGRRHTFAAERRRPWAKAVGHGQVAVSLPVWESRYDWPDGDGYFGWDPLSSSPDPEGYSFAPGLEGRRRGRGARYRSNGRFRVGDDAHVQRRRRPRAAGCSAG